MVPDELLDSTFADENIEDQYRLSPVQEGILMHVLREPQAAAFFQQKVLPYGNLDVPHMIAAWEQVVARHPILRTSFHWQGLEQPVQVVHRQVRLPVEKLDWSEVPEADRERRLNTLLRQLVRHNKAGEGLFFKACFAGEETQILVLFVFLCLGARGSPCAAHLP